MNHLLQGWEDKNNSDRDKLHKSDMSTKRKWVIAFIFF